MGVTRKERLLKAMLEDNAAACGGGVTMEERLLAQMAKKVCENDSLEGGGAASWNDLTDVPFGEKEEWVGHIPETSVTFSKGGYGEYKETFTSYGALNAGDYKVIFDGKEYYVSPMYQGINMMPAGEMSEEMPFQFQSSFGKLYVFAPGKHTIAVYRKKNVVTMLPGKYIVTKINLGSDGSLAAINGEPVTNKQAAKDAFVYGFENGIVRTYQYDNGLMYYGTVIGYKMSGNTVNVKYCNGSDGTIAEAAWSLA